MFNSVVPFELRMTVERALQRCTKKMAVFEFTCSRWTGRAGSVGWCWDSWQNGSGKP